LEIANLFIVVEPSGNYVFDEDNPAPIPLRARVVRYDPGA
jgi:hypothetical protein